MFVHKKKFILDVAIVLFIIYQCVIGIKMITNGKKRTIPLLYEESINHENVHFIKIFEQVEEIKQTNIFNTKSRNVNKSVIEVADITNSPIYSGGIKLVGVLKHTDELDSIAIIEANGKQKTYFIKDEIESSNINIVKILSDKIIISEGGLYYSLFIL